MPSPTDQNEIGIPYILMSKAPGVPLSTYRWDSDVNSKIGCDSLTNLTSGQKEKIIRQLGEVHAHLSNLRFNQLGSLYPYLSDGNFVLGTCLYPGLIWQGRDEFSEDDIPRGLFNYVHEFYKALISALFAHLRELPMEHHLFHAPVPIPQEYESYGDYRISTDRWNDYVAIGSKAESVRNRLDYALAGVALIDIVPLLAEKEKQFKCCGFPLYHPDLSTSNIFVDDEFNITCIIDWAFASTVPQSMLLVCPGLPHARDGIAPYLAPLFSEGFIKGRGFDNQKDLDFSNGAILWEFTRLVNFDALQDYRHFSKLLRLVNRDETYPSIYKLKDRPEFIETSKFLLQYETDSDRNMDEEKQYFACVGPERLALSQHLTMISGLNPNFVADQRLWRWIKLYLKEREIYMFHGDTRKKLAE